MALLATAYHLLRKHGSLRRLWHQGSDLLGIIFAVLLFLVVQSLIRLHFGISAYVCPFWEFLSNFENMTTFNSWSIWVLGSGLIWLFAFTVVQGNRYFTDFLLSYTLILFNVAFFISSFNEHRVFMPCFPLIIASMVRFQITWHTSGAGAYSPSLHQ